MGVTSVLVWRSSGASAGPRAFDSLCAAVESLRGGSKRRYNATVTILKALQDVSGASAGSDLWLLQFSDRPRHTSMVLRKELQVIEAEAQVLTILGQVNTHRLRYALTMEGQQYTLGDFVVRVCNLTVKASGEHRGTVVQVEYLPSSSAECTPLLQEFATVLQEAAASAGGSLEAVEAPLADFALPPRFCHQHLAVQTTHLISHVLAA